MIKLSLQNAKSVLSRAEMIKINGGYDGSGSTTQAGNQAGWPSSPNYVYGAPGQAMLSQANPNGNPTYPSGSSSAPVGGDAANDANELVYFAQAVSNGIKTVTSWFN